MPTAVTGLHVVAPSTVGVNERFDLGLRVLTEPYFTQFEVLWFRQVPAVNGPFNLSPRGTRYMDNVPPEWRGHVTIDGGAALRGPQTISFADGTGPLRDDTRPIRRLAGFSFATPGIHFIRVREPATGVEAISNPICVEAQPPGERLWWGDLHVHTSFTDALRCPEELYTFARDEAFLDICALSDHSEFLTNDQWDYFAAVANRFNTPGRFATLVGGEWTSRAYGHRNYYYRGERGPVLRSTDPATAKLADFYTAARRLKALVIPHHPANTLQGIDWSKGHDPELERLVEIHSGWGNSERAAAQGNPLPIQFSEGEKAGQHVVDALARGYRFGFTGGGDIHDGRPGDALDVFQTHLDEFRLSRCQGLMGVWAKNLTREAIFDALWNRRVYATTSQRTWLKFSINDHSMGGEFVTDGELKVRIDAASGSPITRVDLVRNGTDAQVLRPQQPTVTWQISEPKPTGPVWYYVRVTRQDGHLAWSSPIWISPA